MNLELKHFVPALIVLGIAVAAVTLIAPTQTRGEIASAQCTASTTLWAIGHQEAKTVLPARSNRAFGMIEQPINATNTVTVATHGSAAVAGRGHQLTAATTTSPVTDIRFGRNADYAYTGLVSAITNTASTSVIVTECLY